MPKKSKTTVKTLTHSEAKRKNIPTAEYQVAMAGEEKSAQRVAYPRRNLDLDPQLMWRNKDLQDEYDLLASAPPLYIQEKIHPKALIDDLRRHSAATAAEQPHADLFGDFNGVPEGDAKTEFYQHDANWSNRMILGDSLQVMASLAEREGLRGKVQCIYLDPPYGIKFNSNFQWSTTSRDVKDGDKNHITREPEQVKAFRDTWRHGIHSYLTYLRDRLTVARDLLAESGSIFVQIGDENVHRVRAVMDEVFGDENFVSLISFRSSVPLGATYIPGIMTYIIFYAKSRASMKFRRLFTTRDPKEETRYSFVENDSGEYKRITTNQRDNLKNIMKANRLFVAENLNSAGRTESCVFPCMFEGSQYSPTQGKSWKTNRAGLERLRLANRVLSPAKNLNYKLYLDDYPVREFTDVWMDTQGASDKTYIVQTSNKVIQRCILMTTDPGDLVLDPTCGAGTTAYVAEQWGRRWITIDTSRVALALARARIMGAKYPYYLLADSVEGQQKEADLVGKVPADTPTYGDLRQGFVCERVPHITLKSIANNAEIDVIWAQFQADLEPLRAQINAALGENWQEWEIPRLAAADWPAAAKKTHADWWQQRIARQRAIDASIAAKADFEYLHDKPYAAKNTVRVAGPFTVESVSPHRVLGVDENDELIDGVSESLAPFDKVVDFADIILENLKTAGVQQSRKADKIEFQSLTAWPGSLICAAGVYQEGAPEDTTPPPPPPPPEKSGIRAAIFIGPEFATVTRVDLADAAREAMEAGFDTLIACAFSYDAHAMEFNKIGKFPVLKARMNADLHLAADLKSTDTANLFVIFGEPDIDIIDADAQRIKVRVKGVDVFHPNSGEVRSDSTDGIACWFVDTDYNEESFFVRQAYFLGATDPYKALKTTLKSEINADTWATLNTATSRPFQKPPSGRIAVKVINHLGDEVMKVFRM